MQLELSEEEADALRALLQQTLSDLKGEIHDTDNVSFRKGLAHERETLETIRTRLGA
ncbi:MAG TPA: hypothetical protein VGZ03_05430 [Acidimicrobiales bacterium]|jgi:hypothetical protein|nr:hypothetical protein [Acidimicrobiales bacterium]